MERAGRVSGNSSAGPTGGLGRSNGLEGAQGSLKSLMEVWGPDEGDAEG